MYRDRGRYTILRLKKQIWRERQVFLLIMAILCLFIFYYRWAAGLYAVRVEGVVVVWAQSKKDAWEIVKRVEEKQGGKIPPSVKPRFKQELKIKREKFTGEEVPDLEEAVAKLLPHLDLLVRASVIMVDGRPVVAVPSRGTAELVRTEAKRKLAPAGAPGERMGEDYFKEKVEIEERDVPVEIFRTEEEQATAVLLGESAPRRGQGPAVTLVSVWAELERGSGGDESGPARMVTVTYENGKKVAREPQE